MEPTQGVLRNSPLGNKVLWIKNLVVAYPLLVLTLYKSYLRNQVAIINSFGKNV